jgi:hypothetical protein
MYRCEFKADAAAPAAVPSGTDEACSLHPKSSPLSQQEVHALAAVFKPTHVYNTPRVPYGHDAGTVSCIWVGQLLVHTCLLVSQWYAEQVGKELLPIVQQEPTLRQGSFAAAMEEVGYELSRHADSAWSSICTGSFCPAIVCQMIH